MADEALKIVLLGKTGMGKSTLGNSLANTIKGEEFKVSSGLRSETTHCDWKSGRHPNGLLVEVVDTPGLCDTHRPQKDIYKEVAKTVALADSGPHVLIIAIRCDRRFTDEEYGAYQTIVRLFTEEINKHLIVVFNGLDGLSVEDDEEMDEKDKIAAWRQRLDAEICKFGDKLNTIIHDARGGYFGMSNKVTKSAKQAQIQELLAKMLELKKTNSNKRFATDVTRQIETAVKELENEYATSKGLSPSAAANQVKQDIVQEKVNPGFFARVVGVIGSAASRVGAAFTNGCSVM